jgi:phosphatidylethanolamine/phosphatidyl-N-methylethanolamine N-methyltransferase
MSESVGSVYDKIAPVYNFVFGRTLEGARRKAIQFAKIQSSEKVLEVGVGTGLTFRHLPENIDFTGVDLSEKMLEQASKKAKKLGLNYTLKQMNATKLEFPNESFDLVICAHFLSATSNPLPALLEIKRVVKKNGRVLLVNNLQRHDIFSKILEPLVQRIGISLKLSLEDLCRESGFKVLKRERVSLLPIDAVLLVP